MAVVYGESDIEIDAFIADEVIELSAEKVEEAIIEQRQAAENFRKSFLS